MKLYVYAICRDEAKFAARWMVSMSEADGVYVLDTGSSDGSPEQLEELGAHVARRQIQPWRFDDARNLSLDLTPEDGEPGKLRLENHAGVRRPSGRRLRLPGRRF